jgi:hypothetical protein
VPDDPAEEAGIWKSLIAQRDIHFILGKLVLDHDRRAKGSGKRQPYPSPEYLVAYVVASVIVDADVLSSSSSEVTCQGLGEEVDGNTLILHPDGYSIKLCHLRVFSLLELSHEDRIVHVPPRTASGDMLEIAFF